METNNKLYQIEEVVKLIKKGNPLVLAGNENQLKKLPQGNWIGGTIPYFMDTTGGCFDKNKIFVTDFSDLAIEYKIRSYKSNEIESIMTDRYENGFSFILLPCFSDILSHYALTTPKMSKLYDTPLLGWVTGIDLNEIGDKTPKTIIGLDGQVFDNQAVVLHVKLPDNLTAGVEIINIFSQGNGDVITVENDGFEFSECLINGKKTNLVQYVKEKNIDIKLPLVADYSGAKLNISFQQVNEEEQKVLFYAPLHKGIEYRLAKPVENYVSSFKSMVPEDINVAISCNCILNYLYSELDGKKTGLMRGPFTFGEIAYILVNQTLVYLRTL